MSEIDIFDAIIQNNIHFVQTIINQDPSVIDHRQKYRKTVLHCACDWGHYDIAQLLIDAGADVNAKDKAGRTPLHLACQHDHTDLARLLIDAGADVNAKDEDGWTPLQFSCIYGFTKIVQLLIDRGANVDVADGEGWTPLHIACLNRRTTIVPLLIRAGADWLSVNDNDQTPVDNAIKEQSNVMLNFLETIVDQLPDPERKKIQAWRFRQEIMYTNGGDSYGYFYSNRKK